MLKQGPGIYYTEFGVQIKFMIIQLLRIFITYSGNSLKLKQEIMTDKNRETSIGVIRFNHSVLNYLMDQIKPDNLMNITEDIENATMSLFITLFKDNATYQEEFMREYFPKVMQPRLYDLVIYRRYRQVMDSKEKINKKDYIMEKPVKASVLFTEKTEKKFFRLIQALSENEKFAKEMAKYQNVFREYYDFVDEDMHKFGKNKEEFEKFKHCKEIVARMYSIRKLYE